MKEKFKQPARAIRLWFWLFAAACLIAAFIMPDRDQTKDIYPNEREIVVIDNDLEVTRCEQ